MISPSKNARPRRTQSLRLKRGPFALLGLMLLALLVWAAGSAASGPTEPAHSQASSQAGFGRLSSAAAILLDRSSGEVLAEKNGDQQIFPASLTKLLTAVVALEALPELDEPVELPADIFPPLYEQNASMAGFLPGETARARDLLYGALLPSGAECCLALAKRVAGSEASFVEKMNQKAEELGMKDSHFCNSTGLHDDRHVSTVRDLATLLEYALKNETFRAAFTAARYSIPPTNLHPDGFTVFSRLFQALETPELPDGEILGGKTGYTDEAGLCLASLARVDGREYLLITAGAAGSHQTEPFHILDALRVYRGLAAGRYDNAGRMGGEGCKSDGVICSDSGPS